MSFGRSIGCVVGMAAAGPVGSLVGSLTGGLMEIAIGSTLTSLVGQEASSLISTKVGEILTTATTEQVQKASRFLFKLDTEERHRLNSDLQQAFRDALCEAIYDIGGPKSFPRIWKPTKRDVPDEVIYAAAQRTDEIAVQAQACLGKFEQAVREERILSLDSLTAQGAPHIATYPQVSTPKDLLDTFFADVVDPLLSNDLDLCLVCSSELKLHLRSYLLDRTLLHLGELLKQPERTQAWRTFNRLLIEGMREDIAKIETGQLEIMQRLDTLLSRPEAAFADNMADLLTATGKLDKQLDENFDTLFERIAAQHLELLESFDQLTDVARRTESKIDRVLRILENGQYVIQGAPPISPDEPPFPGEPPFKGLQCFDIADTECFFGREVLTARLVTRISEQLSRQECRFLAVVGSSGSGKSSVVRAGLLPALQRGQPLVDGKLPPEGSEHWAVHVLTPTSHPLDALAISLTRRSGSLAAAETLAQDLAQSTRSLHLAACRIVDRSSSVGQLLLVVDQFEELFTTCKNEDERKAFIANLLYAVRQAGPTLVVITLRADFYAACACYDELREVVAQQQEFIGLMNAQELRRAIEGPAEYSNWQFEPGLVELILHDVGDEPGALPLLSHALLETWKRRRGRIMTLESYAESGGVRGAIARTATTVYEHRLTAEQRIIARGIFLRLTELGEGTQDTRRRASLAELVHQPEDAPAVETVVKMLTEARLLVADNGASLAKTTSLTNTAIRPVTDDHETQVIEVAHEALIREWPMLRSWLDEDREGLRTHRALAEKRQPTMSILPSNVTGEDVVTLAFSPNKQQHILASTREGYNILLWDVDKHTLIAPPLDGHNDTVESVAFSPDGTILASSSRDSTIRLWDGMNGKTLGEPLEGHLSAIPTVAFNHDGTILASGSCGKMNGDSCKQGEIRLWKIPDGKPASEPLLGHTDYVSSLSYSPDGNVLASGSEDGTIIVWDMTTDPPQALGTPFKGQADIQTVAFNKDGTLLASGSSDSTIMLWDVATHTEHAVLTGHKGIVTKIVFSPDGMLLASSNSDGKVIVWNIQAAQPVATFEDDGGVNAVGFSPDGQILAAGGDTGQIMLYDLNLESWRKRACAIVGRSLTETEWQQYLPQQSYRAAASCP